MYLKKKHNMIAHQYQITNVFFLFDLKLEINTIKLYTNIRIEKQNVNKSIKPNIRYYCYE